LRKREVSSIDAPPKPKVDVQEAIANAKVYCKQNPESFVNLRVVAFTTKPAQPLQQNSTSLIPHTKSAQIDPRRIGSVSLAANGPTGQL
jgi:hypothetical protein